MSSYKDLPLDVEKYSISPYLSSKDIASLSSVDRKRRDIYDLKYWEKRLLSEEGVDLFDYKDGSSPYVRYCKSKKYSEAKKRFDTHVKDLKYYSPNDRLEKALYDSSTLMIKYGTPSHASYLVKQRLCISKDLEDYPLFFEDIWFFIAKYGSPLFVKETLSSSSKEGLDIEYFMLPIIIEKGRIDVLREFEISKQYIIDVLVTLNIDISKENLLKILDYASTLKDKVRKSDWMEKVEPHLDSSKKELMNMIKRKYPSLSYS